MTVCIAAICLGDDNDDQIVLCADKKLSSALGSAETGYKILWIAKHWRLLTAGDEPDIMALHRLFKQRFADPGNRKAETIDELINWPLRQRKRQLADDYTFSHFGMSHAEFLANGKARLPEDAFREATRDIANISLNASLIIAGFIDGSAEVYWTDHIGKARAVRDFAIVGEGEYLAQSILIRRNQRYRSTISRNVV